MTLLKESLLLKLEKCDTEINSSELQDMRLVFQVDKKNWIKLVNSMINRVKKKEDFLFFFWILDQFSHEIIEVAPFVAAQLNRVFLLLLKFNYYQQVAAQTQLLEQSASTRLLDEINRIIQEKGFDKYISTMEIYKLKRLVYQLTQKYENKDIAYKLRIELESPDLEWKDCIEK